MTNHMQLKFSARSENELFARMAVSSFITPLNPTLDELTEIKTIISEAVTNAIIHGYNENPNKYVYLDVKIRDRIISITVRDEGMGINNIELARQPLFTTKPEKERSGMGFTIIETFSDKLFVNSDNSGTVLKIVKRLKAVEVLNSV